jgi:P-type Mg2+ transporter
MTEVKVGSEAAAFWRVPLAELEGSLASGPNGLATVEVQARLERFGPNVLAPEPRSHLLLKFLGRFLNPLVLILLVASGISAATGDVASFVIIVTIVLFSVGLDFIQEQRAAAAAASLRDQVALTSHALRDGRTVEIAATLIVPGDVVLVAAGDLIPADGRLLEVKDLYVNEALLTGESFPAEKRAGEASRTGTALSDAANAAFMGSSVVSGTGTLLVVATSRSTQLGTLARDLQREPPPTAFAMGIRAFGMLIVRLTVLLVLFVLLVNVVAGRPMLEAFLFALALAVGLTPELLPMVVSVTLAHGAVRMAKQRVIVKRLSAIHDLGSMDVLCSDKTGTLTEARIELIREVDAAGSPSQGVLDLVYLNSFFETGIKSPLDEAVLARAGQDVSTWRKIDEVPFDFERRRVSVLLERDHARLLVVKGAPEDVLRLATRVQIEGEARPQPLTPEAIERANAVLRGLGREGFRVLGVASREVGPEQMHAHVGDEADLVFAGFAAFLDPPKLSAKPALDALGRLGVAVKVITGDNEHVTEHVCRELGLAIKGLLTGDELAALSDEALLARVETVSLFCRVIPAQKARIVRALRRRGHVVGYLGDGINDAPPLHAADVGLSVDGAADIAKQEAAMILQAPDLGILAEGVREGRRTFTNIMKYVMMGTSSNFGNMFSMAGASLLLPFLPMLPVQILLNNLLYDLSEIPIPMDRVDEEMVAGPRHWDMRFVRDFMLVLGPVSSAFDFLTFALLIWAFHAGQSLFQTGWFIESLATQVLVIFIIRTRGNPFRSRPHRLLAATSVLVVAVAVLLPFTAVGRWFGFVPPPLTLLAALVPLTMAYLAAVQAVKVLFYRKHKLAAASG